MALLLGEHRHPSVGEGHSGWEVTRHRLHRSWGLCGQAPASGGDTARRHYAWERVSGCGSGQRSGLQEAR